MFRKYQKKRSFENIFIRLRMPFDYLYFGTYYRHLAPIIGTPSAMLIIHQNHIILR